MNHFYTPLFVACAGAIFLWQSLPHAMAADANPHFTARNLIDFCADESNNDHDTACKMYVLGFLGAISMNTPRDPTAGICFPGKFSVGEVRAVLKRSIERLYAKKIAEITTNLQPQNMLYVILQNEFPCNKRKKESIFSK
jgi:hypothetical protein